jgi:chromosome segregation ATPase
MGQPGSVTDATALLDGAKKSQQERKRAAKQNELDRISEDVKNGKQEAAELEQNISEVGNAVNESKSNLTLLAGRTKSATQDLELLALRTEAEKLKAEGLNLLNTAQAKALEALTRRQEELDARTAVFSAEIQRMSLPEKVAESDSKKGKTESGPSLTELRRNLAKAEGRSELADAKAREAMDAAARKLEQAEAVAAKAEKKQAEYGLEKHPNAPAKP